jgi:hypothetical protein
MCIYEIIGEWSAEKNIKAHFALILTMDTRITYTQ